MRTSIYYERRKNGKKAEEYAIEACDCGLAKEQRKQARQIQQAQKKLTEIFKFPLSHGEDVSETEGLQNVLGILCECVSEMVRDNIYSMTALIPGIGKISIKTDGTGKIKIKKAMTLSYGGEV